MAYVAVKGGEKAIENSIELLRLSRADGTASLEVDVITSRMKQLIDRVMCEAGFHAPDYAAIALKQSEGSLEEAVFLMRAYRSTLSRAHTSLALDCRNMRLTRRISSAFKDIPAGQMLGATYDYTHRLLDFSLRNEDESELQAYRKVYDEKIASDLAADDYAPVRADRVTDILKAEGLMRDYPFDDAEPEDITQDNLTFPVSRSARLQTLFRADTGFISGVAYAGMRGYGVSAHPTIGELRSGYMEIKILYPLDETETMVIGEILFTEVEALISDHSESEAEHDDLGIAIGYGLVFGRAETRAIAMSILDCALNHPDTASPPNDEEFVLLHGEALEMSGFISHLKLPHYVTYQSGLDNIRKVKRQNEAQTAQAAQSAGAQTVEQVAQSIASAQDSGAQTVETNA